MTHFQVKLNEEKLAELCAATQGDRLNIEFGDPDSVPVEIGKNKVLWTAKNTRPGIVVVVDKAVDGKNVILTGVMNDSVEVTLTVRKNYNAATLDF